MRSNNIIESEYIGWANYPTTNTISGITAHVTGWKNTSELIAFNKMTVEIARNRKCHFYSSSPIICVVNVKDYQTLSEVSKILHLEI